MTRIATMGTSFCATIAIAGFGHGQKELNEAYIADPSTFKGAIDMSVQDFYKKILYPTSQPLGHTDDYPFTALMEALDQSDMKDKFIILTLNQHQYGGLGGYWREQVEKWGFVLIDKTNNAIGQPCFIMTRNNARMVI